MPNLNNKTIFVSGATRGIDKAIALRSVREGANVVVTGKSTQSTPKAPGTMYSTTREVDAGGHSLAVQLDMRDENAVAAAVLAGAGKFGGTDILVSQHQRNCSHRNAGYTREALRADASDERARHLHLLTVGLPYLLKPSNPHILTLSPRRSFARKASAISKLRRHAGRKICPGLFLD